MYRLAERGFSHKRHRSTIAPIALEEHQTKLVEKLKCYDDRLKYQDKHHLWL